MSENSEQPWWKTILSSIVCFALTAYLYYFFTDLEATGETRRIHAVIALLYQLTGKWGACAFTSLIGVVGLWRGFRQWSCSKTRRDPCLVERGTPDAINHFVN